MDIIEDLDALVAWSKLSLSLTQGGSHTEAYQVSRQIIGRLENIIDKYRIEELLGD